MPVWKFAQANDMCIVTRDSDFLEMALARGTPPPVMRLRGDNSSTEHMAKVIPTATNVDSCGALTGFPLVTLIAATRLTLVSR